MTLLALLRHAPTEWNAARRLQGRADIDLSAKSRDELSRRRLPDLVSGFEALSSPLRRCLQTASLLGLAPRSDPRLIEMHWGAFEGHTLTDLRQKLGDELAASEARGIDFRPPEGESPRDVQTRIGPLLREIGSAGKPTIAVTHRGVIRAIYARALDWDMRDDPPHQMDLYALHLFRLDAEGHPAIEQLNLQLGAR